MLPKEHRVSHRNTWQRIYIHGSAVRDSIVILKFMPKSGGSSRFGFSVSVKVDKRAVVRNRIKRRMRAVIAKNQHRIRGGYDVILIARPMIAAKGYDGIERSLVSLLQRAQLLLNERIR